MPGSHAWWLTVKLATVPRPLTASGCRSLPWSTGHTGDGGWTYTPHFPQRRNVSSPRSPPCQKWRLASVTRGRIRKERSVDTVKFPLVSMPRAFARSGCLALGEVADHVLLHERRHVSTVLGEDVGPAV